MEKFIKEKKVSDVYANYEYEFDELNRDRKVVAGIPGVNCYWFHDTTYIEPGTVLGTNNTPMKVFTPYHKQWLHMIQHSHKDKMKLKESIGKITVKVDKELFESELPEVWGGKELTEEEKKRMEKLWPAGHDEAAKRLKEFLHKKISKYAATRSDPGKDSTSRMSPYFSNGVMSTREATAEAYKVGLDDEGVSGWIREIAFREFYRQMILIQPHKAMNLPPNLNFEKMKWDTNEDFWKKWCEGKTGFPFVDAGMRQLNHEKWMHNRVRMNVASFLRCNMFLDFRQGERYFAENLIDWDLCNNGWGWAPNPSTVFNPITQAKNNNPDGSFIRKWVPELKNVQGKAIFNPIDHLSEEEFEKLNYPEPCLDFNETKSAYFTRQRKYLHGEEE